jgi:hypothetical protein
MAKTIWVATVTLPDQSQRRIRLHISRDNASAEFVKNRLLAVWPRPDLFPGVGAPDASQLTLEGPFSSTATDQQITSAALSGVRRRFVPSPPRSVPASPLT